MIESVIITALKNATINDTDYYDNDFLYCGKCRTKKEMVFEIDGNKRVVPILCECELQERENRKERDRLKIIEEKRKRAIPSEYYRKSTLENSIWKLNFAEEYIANWEKCKSENIGLLIYGTYGSGKTYAASAIANGLVDRSVKVYMDSMLSLVNGLADIYGGGRPETMISITNCDCLIVDDFGVERSTEFMLQNVYELIDARLRTGKPMIITTNVDYTELKNPKDERHARIYSRLLSLHPIPMMGEDVRQQKTKDRYKTIKELLS